MIKIEGDEHKRIRSKLDYDKIGEMIRIEEDEIKIPSRSVIVAVR